jgi:hypothetical protein
MAAKSKYRAKYQNIILLFFLFDIQGSFGRIPIYLVAGENHGSDYYVAADWCAERRTGFDS